MELGPKFGQILQLDKPNTTTAKLLQGSSGARAKIWSNFTTTQAYLLQHSYSKAPVELEPKFGQILQLDKPNTIAQLLQGSSGARAKIWSNFTTTQAYLLQHSYSKAPVELGPKFGQILKLDKPNTTTAKLLQGSSGARAKIWSNFTTRQAYLIQHSYSKAPVELGPKFGQILQLDKPNTTALLLQDSSGARAKIWSNFTIDKPTYYSTATPRLKWS